MNSSAKKIKAYIRPGIVLRAALWALAAAAVIFALAGAFLTATADRLISGRFDPNESPDGRYCYIDAVGVSDWLYKYTYDNDTDTYYEVEDPDGRLYIAIIPDDDYTDMALQRRYWNRVTENTPMPEPYKLKGTARLMDESGQTRIDISDVLDVDPAGEYEFFFGQMYLDAGSNPRASSGAACFTGTLFAGLAWLVVMLMSSAKFSHMSKCIRRLRRLGKLDDAAEQLSTAAGCESDCAVCDDYIFIRKSGAAIDYDSIRKCRGFGSMLYITTEHIGEIAAQIDSPELREKFFAALSADGRNVDMSQLRK